MLTLLLSIQVEEDRSGYVLTVLSMIFTIISIGLSVFEHFYLHTKFNDIDKISVITFDVNNSEIASMESNQFKSKFVFESWELTEKISTLVRDEKSDAKIEMLEPKQYRYGALYTLLVDGTSKYIVSNITAAVDEGSLAQVEHIYPQFHIYTHTLFY